MGDQALRLFAETLKKGSRLYDKVGRWGGDEFLCIIPDVDIESLEQIATRIKDEINKIRLELPNGEVFSLKACFGIICVGGGIDDIYSIDDYINMADEALYQAKGLGKNQVKILQKLQVAS
jgi:two-component system chemotaxis response regulator CheY